MFYEWKYIENILKCFSMENCKSVKIPLIKGIILGEELYWNSREKQNNKWYWNSYVSSLYYHTLATGIYAAFKQWKERRAAEGISHII